MAYRDYTPLKNHEVTLWKLSDNVPLNFMGGLVTKVAAAAFGVGLAAGLLVVIPSIILGASAVWGMLVGAAVMVWFYRRSVSERVKTDPVTMVRRRVRHSLAPRRYVGGSTAETRATRLHWQIILWRPDSRTARVGPVRRWVTYTPQPVGYEERKQHDPAPADILLGRRDPFDADTAAFFNNE